MNPTKYLKFIIPAVIFYAAMKSFFDNEEAFYLALAVLFSISALSAFRFSRYRISPVVLITIFTASSVLFLFTLGRNNFQDSYITFFSLLFIFALVGISKLFSQQEKYDHQETINKKILYLGFSLNQTVVLFSVFFLASGVYGIYIDLDLPIWIMMAIIFVGISNLTFYLVKINFLKNKIAKDRMIPFADKTSLFYSILFGFLVAEIFWAMSFLPVNHLTVGSTILCLCYSFWNILQDRLNSKLTKKLAFLNLLFLVVAVSVIFATSKWGIV